MSEKTEKPAQETDGSELCPRFSICPSARGDRGIVQLKLFQLRDVYVSLIVTVPAYEPDDPSPCQKAGIYEVLADGPVAKVAARTSDLSEALQAFENLKIAIVSPGAEAYRALAAPRLRLAKERRRSADAEEAEAAKAWARGWIPFIEDPEVRLADPDQVKP